MNLFEPASTMFSPMTIRFLSSDWPGIFRVQMLHLMPANALGEHFDAKLGCPTKELYGMAGAIFLKECFNLTIPQTMERSLTDAAWQYILNANPMEASSSHAMVEGCVTESAGRAGPNGAEGCSQRAERNGTHG